MIILLNHALSCRVENLAEFTVAARWEGYLNIIGSANKIKPEVNCWTVKCAG